MTVQLFIPCLVDQLYPEVGFSTIKILEKLGCTVEYNPKQHCCGQPAYASGYENESRAVAKLFMSDFSNQAMVVAPSGNCVGFVRTQLAGLFPSPETKEEVALLGKRMFELSEFLIDNFPEKHLNASLKGKAVYMDACGALNQCGIKTGPRKLLGKVKGLELIESNFSDACCGFGGRFAKEYQPISEAMAMTKINEAMQLGADYIISSDASCLLHLKGYINKNNSQLKILHLAEVLSNF